MSDIIGEITVRDADVEELAKFLHWKYGEDHIAEWDDLREVTKEVWREDAKAAIYLLAGSVG